MRFAVQDRLTTAAPVLELIELRRSFHQGTRNIHVLDGAGATLMPGQAVALVGPSGAGKSTLLHIAGLLETPDSGRVMVNSRDCSKMDDDARTRVRRGEMGFVYQFHQLLPEFSAVENVMLPQLIQGKRDREARVRATELLTGLGLAERLDHRPAELSGGEQQRTAIARALANAPRLLFADEPTGNLDPKTSDRVFEALLEIVTSEGLAALVATHDSRLARRLDRVIVIRDQKLVEVDHSSLDG